LHRSVDDIRGEDIVVAKPDEDEDVNDDETTLLAFSSSARRKLRRPPKPPLERPDDIVVKAPLRRARIALPRRAKERLCTCDEISKSFVQFHHNSTRGGVVRPPKRQTGGKRRERNFLFLRLSFYSSLLRMSVKTELAYLRDTYAFKTSSSSSDDDVSTVLDVLKTTKINEDDDDERWYSYGYEIVLDKTIAYPAGGGQPSDVGTISIDTNTRRWMFDFEEVRMDKETKQVLHRGTFRRRRNEEEENDDDVFDVDEMKGKPCSIEIDENVRMAHAKMHTAGHLLDVAVALIPGLEKLVATKGSHGVADAYVEYKGNARTFSGIEDDDEKLIRLINEHLEKLIEQNDVVKAEYLAYEDAKRACGGSLPSYVSPDAEESPRVVTVAGCGCPCGGTHVKSSKELKRVTAVGFRVKKGQTRIRYEVDI
jgi:Ser-tRNA(Ala) deacylase AlaX